jgi:hypothetical protein
MGVDSGIGISPAEARVTKRVVRHEFDKPDLTPPKPRTSRKDVPHGAIGAFVGSAVATGAGPNTQAAVDGARKAVGTASKVVSGLQRSFDALDANRDGKISRKPAAAPKVGDTIHRVLRSSGPGGVSQPAKVSTVLSTHTSGSAASKAAENESKTHNNERVYVIQHDASYTNVLLDRDLGSASMKDALLGVESLKPASGGKVYGTVKRDVMVKVPFVDWELDRYQKGGNLLIDEEPWLANQTMNWVASDALRGAEADAAAERYRQKWDQMQRALREST